MNALPKSSLRQRLRAGEFVLGTFLEIASPALVEILGLAGFDFLIIDREHGSIDIEACEGLIRAAQCAGIEPIVRVAENHPVLVRQPLDMGAAGVQVPQIGSQADALQVVKSAMFAPEGERGLQPFVRGASYRAIDPAAFMANANRDSVVVVHIEGESGASNLDAILQVERIDVIFIGPYDLSQSLGVPGQVHHPRVEKRVGEIAAMAHGSGKCVGMFCDNPSSVANWRSMGITYAALSIDATIFLNACRGLVNEVKEHS
ncbi:MAG: aldolase/citrate lyase family protein [Acidobacteriota bacterium]